TRLAAGETGGIDAQGDARKRVMIVPKVPALDIITETQADNWVRVTRVRVKDTDSLEKVIPLAPPSNGHQSVVVIALGTIESTRLAINTFKDSLAWRAAQRMGKNLIAHLRSMGCSLRRHFCCKFQPISPFNCKLTEVFAYFRAGPEDS